MDNAQKKSSLNSVTPGSLEAAQNTYPPAPYSVHDPVHAHPPHPPHRRTPHPPPHHRGHMGLNSLLAETLEELSSTFQDVQTIEAIVHELDEDAFPIFARVAGEGIVDPRAFLERFLELEALERLNTRSFMLSDVTQNLAVVLLPLPPYITDLLRPILHPELTFHTTEHPPVHIQKDHFRPLDFEQFRHLLSSTSQTDALILDGQLLRNVLLIRASAASILELLVNRALKRIYLHKIPHLPRRDRFVSLDISHYEVEIRTI